MKISSKGLDLIKHFESLHDGDLTKIGLQPKLCPADIVTIGYGRALKDENGKWLKGSEGMKKAAELYPELMNMTEEQAVIMLDEDCDDRENRLNSLGIHLEHNEFDALVSFIYNVGFANFKRSSLLKRILLRDDADRITKAFGMWDKARVDGVLTVLPGLVRRRMAEAYLYNYNVLKFNFTR